MMASLQSSSVEVSSAASSSESWDDGVTQTFTSLSLSTLSENNTSPASPSLGTLHRSMVRVLPAESSSSRPMKEDESNEKVTVAVHIGPPSSVDLIASMDSCSEMRSEAALPAVSGFTVASVCLIAPASCSRRIFQIQTRRKRRVELGTIMEGSEVADIPVSACLRWSEHKCRKKEKKSEAGDDGDDNGGASMGS